MYVRMSIFSSFPLATVLTRPRLMVCDSPMMSGNYELDSLGKCS